MRECVNCGKWLSYTKIYTESSKYYAHIQTAVARSLRLPTRRLATRQTAAASKHSLCYFSSFSEKMVTCINVHLQSGIISVYWLWLLLYVSAVSVVIVIIAICDMPRQEFSLCECVNIFSIRRWKAESRVLKYDANFKTSFQEDLCLIPV